MNNFWQKLKKPILALSPMAGITDSAFRQICRGFGVDVVYTEMISADGLFYDSKKTIELLKFKKIEQPIICQLFGKRPEVFGRAAKIVEQAGFSGIDINFGCPAKKVVAHGGGVTLMREIKKSKAIIKAVIEATKLPVSIKIRASINKPAGGKITALDFLENIIELPMAAIMIHGRSYEQGFAGPINYEMIKKTVKKFGKRWIILANGGINTPQDAKVMLERTKAAGIGIARGAEGRPWLFGQIKDYLKTGRFREPEWPEIKEIIINHAKLVFKEKGSYGVIELRKHLCWYIKGMPNASSLRQELVKVKSIKEIKEILEEIGN